MTGPTSSARPTGAKRRRPMLLSFTALGVVVGLLGVAGVFATSSDRATTGQNDARSGDLAVEPDVELRITTAAIGSYLGDVACDELGWSDDLVSGVNVSHGEVPVTPWYESGAVCLRNDSSFDVDVTMTAFDVVETELACSPGELEAGDATCGSGPGELARDVRMIIRSDSDLAACYRVADLHPFPDFEDGSLVITTLAPGEVAHMCSAILWEGREPVSQTDQVAWRWAFDAVPAVPVACRDDGHEPNDSMDGAAMMNYFTHWELILCPGDTDWYRVDLRDAAYPLSIAGFEGAGDRDLDLVLYDAAGHLLDDSTGSGPVESVDVPAGPRGSYAYARVTGKAGASGFYVMGVGTEP